MFVHDQYITICHNTTTQTVLHLTGGGENILAARLLSDLRSSCVASALLLLLLAPRTMSGRGQVQGRTASSAVDQVTG